MGKTTNERFSKKAQGSFSDATTYLDPTENESLMEGSSKHSVEYEEAPEKRRTSKRVTRPKRNCFQSWKHMMCSRRIVSQEELYERQVNKIDALTESFREATGGGRSQRPSH